MIEDVYISPLRSPGQGYRKPPTSGDLGALNAVFGSLPVPPRR